MNVAKGPLQVLPLKLTAVIRSPSCESANRLDAESPQLMVSVAGQAPVNETFVTAEIRSGDPGKTLVTVPVTVPIPRFSVLSGERVTDPVRLPPLTSPQEFVDRGVSGSKDTRPALDALIRDAKRRRFDVLVCWRLDRLGRNLRHLVTLLEEIQGLGVAFVSLGEGIDCTTPAGKLQLHILAALAEFERERIRERVMAGIQRARAQGKQLGRPRARPATVAIPGGSVRGAAKAWGVSKSTAARWINASRPEPASPASTPERALRRRGRGQFERRLVSRS